VDSVGSTGADEVATDAVLSLDWPHAASTPSIDKATHDEAMNWSIGRIIVFSSRGSPPIDHPTGNAGFLTPGDHPKLVETLEVS